MVCQSPTPGFCGHTSWNWVSGLSYSEQRCMHTHAANSFQCSQPIAGTIKESALIPPWTIEDKGGLCCAFENGFCTYVARVRFMHRKQSQNENGRELYTCRCCSRPSHYEHQMQGCSREWPPALDPSAWQAGGSCCPKGEASQDERRSATLAIANVIVQMKVGTLSNNTFVISTVLRVE